MKHRYKTICAAMALLLCIPPGASGAAYAEEAVFADAPEEVFFFADFAEEEPSAEPEAFYEEPEESYAIPEEPSQEPEEPAAEPEEPTAEPQESIAEPQEPTASPEDSDESPEESPAPVREPIGFTLHTPEDMSIVFGVESQPIGAVYVSDLVGLREGERIVLTISGAAFVNVDDPAETIPLSITDAAGNDRIVLASYEGGEQPAELWLHVRAEDWSRAATGRYAASIDYRAAAQAE